MDKSNILAYLKERENYLKFRQLEDGRLIGIMRMAFTTALVVNIDHVGYSGRYCYKIYADALEDFRTWDGVNDPEGEWLKYKGYGKEYCKT